MEDGENAHEEIIIKAILMDLRTTDIFSVVFCDPI